MGFIDIIKSFAKDALKEGTKEVVRQAPGFAKDGVRIVKDAITKRHDSKDISVDITEPEEKEVFSVDFAPVDAPAEAKEEVKSEEPLKTSILSDEVYELRRKVNALTKELEEEKGKTIKSANEIDLLNEKIRECRGFIDTLAKTVSSLENENKKMSAQLGAINEKINLINKRIPSKVITYIAFSLAAAGIIAVAVLYFIH